MCTTTVRVRRTVNPGGQPVLTFAIDGPPCDDQVLDLDPTLPPIDELLQFESTPDADSDVIANAGSAIHDKLSAHGNLAQALQSTLATPIGRESREIRIHIEPIAKVAHNLPWETLLHPEDGFVALSRDLPFSRAVPPVSADSVRGAAPLDGTLKILGVLAASEIPGALEWAAIERAARQWPADSLDVLLLVDRPELKQQIETDILQKALRGFAVELVPGNVESLVQRIGDHAPHILHLFCHGRSDGGGVLEVATPATALGQPPLYLRPGPLASAARSSFLVVLNACSTAAVSQDAETNSIACSLVEQGVPFVTSMRQQVAAKVAHLFAATLLDKVVHDLKSDHDKGASFRPSIAPAVMAARRTIMDASGPAIGLQRRFKEWTLPVLCTSSAPFVITPVKAVSQQEGTETMSEIRVLRSILATGTLSDDVRQKIEARIADLELQLV
jgi:hypothetical protein